MARIHRLCVAGTFVLAALASRVARADVVPPGLVRVSHSIHVDVEGGLPPGKVLLMTGTIDGAKVIDTATVVPFRIGGTDSPRLYLIDSGDLPALNEVLSRWSPGKSAYEARRAITDRGTPCSDYLEVKRRAEETSPVKEVRLFFVLEADGHSCASRLLRTELLSEHGDVLDSQSGSTRWPAAEAQPSISASAVEPAAHPSSGPPAVSAGPSSPGSLPVGTSPCGACAVGARADDRYFALLVLLCALAWGRRTLAWRDRARPPTTKRGAAGRLDTLMSRAGDPPRRERAGSGR